MFRINLIDNKPVLTFYKYIGRIGLSNLNLDDGDQVSDIIDSSVNYFNMLQINSVVIPNTTSDKLITQLTYMPISELSISTTTIQRNSRYKVLLNFNYLSSSFYDTLLGIALCYRLNNGPENIIGEYTLGNEITSFQHDFFSNNFYANIFSEVNDNINFYVKGKIITNNPISDYTNNQYFPKIIFSKSGNILSIEEVNLVQQILSNNYLNIIQIVSTGLIQGVSDEIIDYPTYELLPDLSLNLTTKKSSSKFKILLNFNYLASSYSDTFLNVTLFL